MLQVLELSPIISQDITSVSGTRMCWTGMPRRLQWLMPRTQSRLIVRWRMLNSDLLICAPMLVNWLFSSRYVIICFGLRLIITVHSSGAALLCCWTDIGRKEKQAGPILGWSHPLPTRSFLAGNVQAWMGVKCTPLVLVLHVIVHNLHLNKWCDQLLSIRRSWSLKIPLWRFGICTYCAGSSTCGGESFDNIQCVQKSPQLRT